MISTIKKAYESCPIVIYPTEQHITPFSDRQYSLPSSSGTDSSTFNLGVYNLQPIESSTSLIPLDPPCLTALFALTDKTNSSFPSKDKQNIPSSGKISILSYHCSIDSQLPILIEDSKDDKAKVIKRKIRSSQLINVFNKSNLSIRDSLVVDLLDSRLFDFYIFSILNNSSDDMLIKLYSLNNNEQLNRISFLFIKSLRSHLVYRLDFNLRNPSISTINSETFLSPIIPKYLSKAADDEKERILEEGEKLLIDLENYFKSEETWPGNESPNLLDFKIAGYIICMSELSNDILPFKNILNATPNLISHSNRILSSVI